MTDRFVQLEETNVLEMYGSGKGNPKEAQGRNFSVPECTDSRAVNRGDPCQLPFSDQSLLASRVALVVSPTK
jgi:hypothetical protein